MTRSRWLSYVLLVAAPCAQPVQALSLEEALAASRSAQPALRAWLAEEDAGRAEADAEARRPAPEWRLDLDNLPVTGSAAFDPRVDEMTMLALSVEQMLPSRELREAASGESGAMADTLRRRAELSALGRFEAAGLAWIDWWMASEIARLLDGEGEALELAIDQARVAARSSEEAGLRLAELRVERAELAAQSYRNEGERARARARLRAWTGIEVDATPGAPADWPEPECAPSAQELAQHPGMRQAQARVALAAAAQRRVQAGNRPQWSLMARYGVRADGRPDMLGVGVKLRFDGLAGPRAGLFEQAAALRVEAAEERAIEQARQLQAQWQAACAAYQEGRREEQELAAVLMEAASAHAEWTRLRYAAGRGDLAAVLDAERMHWRHERERIEARARSWRERLRIRAFEIDFAEGL